MPEIEAFFRRSLDPTQFERVERTLCNKLFRERTCVLDGVGRRDLAARRPAGPLTERPRSHLQALYVDDERRGRLKRATKEAFGFYVLIDPTDLGHFQFCLANVDRPDLERSLTPEALEFFARALPMDKASDGVKAYTGILAAVLSAHLDVILIDEPEAFLHPPLARRLGFLLAELAEQRGVKILAATHSADFLAGCVQSGSTVDVVRLTYDGGVPSARLLANERLNVLLRDPLLRSSNVLSSVFYRGAVICEADTDRAFYSEINDRLLRSSGGGVQDAVFLNAQNWQTVARIVGPLREMGIPAAAIVDLDVLLSSDFSRLLEAASVPRITASGLTQVRAHLKASV